MSDLILRVENLGKKYRIRHQGQRPRYVALRDVLAEKAKGIFDQLNLRKAQILKSATDAGPSLAPPPKHSSVTTWPRLSGVEEFWALRDVSFEVNRGEVVGIIGRNGAGKSTLLKILSRITEPTTGRVELRGRVASLLEVGTGFHPELTGRENIFLNGAILGMTRAEVRRQFDAIVAFADVEQFLDTPVKRYSSGMYVRLAFAVAAHLEPEILLVDEVLAVGDAEFQKKCLGKMGEVARGGRTVLFVSHNLQHIRHYCERVLLLESGRCAFDGPCHSGLTRYCGSLFKTPLRPRDQATRISSVHFRNGANQLAVQVQRSAELTFEIDLEAGRSITKPAVSINVHHHGGAVVFSEAWFGACLTPGRHKLAGSFSARHLKAEPYFISTFFFEGEVCLDRLEGVPLPEIIDGEAEAWLEARRWGVARVSVQWRLVSQLS
jgi:ABC-type polysaccharide/polyol phosphate transport system ATPase subunit